MTNNDGDQLYDWPTVIQLIQMYGGHMEVWGIQMYGGVRMYGAYRCMRGI